MKQHWKTEDEPNEIWWKKPYYLRQTQQEISAIEDKYDEQTKRKAKFSIFISISISLGWTPFSKMKISLHWRP